MLLLEEGIVVASAANPGLLHAHFVVDGTVTRIAESRCVQPLKLTRTFAQPDGSLVALAMDVSPGLMDGDVHDWQLTLDACARVSVESQGAMRVHPARGGGGAGGRQVLVADVGGRARLDWAPLPTIPFEGAVLDQRHEVTLAPDATLVWCEATCVGREAHGELHAYGEVATRLTVRDPQGALLHATRSRITPSTTMPHSVAAVPTGIGCWGTVHVVHNGDGDAGYEAAVEIALSITSARVTVGALDHGWVASILAPRMSDLVEATTAVRTSLSRHQP